MKNKKRLYWEFGLGLLGILVFALVWNLADKSFRTDLINKFAELASKLDPEDEGKLLWGSFKAEEFDQVARCFKVFFALGIAFFPLSALLFRKFSDKGYVFGKVIGLVVTGWLVYVLSFLHIAKFTVVTGYVVLGICFAVNYGLLIFLCRKKKVSVLQFLGISDGSAVLTKIVWYEVLFFAVLAILLYMKSFHPDFCWQTEGVMDYGFMVSLDKSEYMPPEDFWYSGTYLNYYYFGQYLCTYLSKLCGVSMSIGYNLSLMSIAAFGVVLSYALVAQIFGLYMKERSEAAMLKGTKTVASVPVLQQVLPRFAGLLAGCGVTFSCTNHYWLYRKVAPVICDILGVDGNHDYWISDPTRYIGWQGEALDQTIHEMPAYSFVLGDLHAHVIDIINVLTVLAILFAFLMGRRERMKNAVAGTYEKVDLKKELANPDIIALGFFCGIFQMTNFWDFPIYFVVCGAVILVSNAVICGFNKKTFILTAVHAAEFIVLSFVTAFLFNLHFEGMTNGIGICDRHTEVYQMIVVWGMPILMIIGYLVSNIKEEQKRRAEGISATEHKNVFFAWLQNLKASELFVLILGLCALGLILLPELVYVDDIYGEVSQRSNTMFKLTYQAFILLALCAGMIITKWFLLPKSGKQFVAGAVLLFILCRNVEYYGYAWEKWAGDYKDPGNAATLNALSEDVDISDADLAAIDWINENIEGRPTILEAHGPSYRQDYKVIYGRISSMTGCPTVIGWHTHEWLWKNDVDAVNARADDVEAIYACADKELGTMLLKQYDVDYLYVGKLEFLKYKDDQGNSLLDYDYLRSLGEVVYEGIDESEFYQTFIVKIK